MRFASFRFPYVVDSLIVGYPAASAGLQVGDSITHLDGKSIAYYDFKEEMLKRKKANASHEVTLTSVSYTHLNHMKKDYMAWNKDTVDDRKISDDLTELSDGKLQMTDSIVRLMAERIDQNYRPKVNNQNNRNNNRNNKRKY